MELLTCTPESSRQHLPQAGNWCRKWGLPGFAACRATGLVFSSYLMPGPQGHSIWNETGEPKIALICILYYKENFSRKYLLLNNSSLTTKQMNGIESILKLLHYFEIAGKILNTFLVCCILRNRIIEKLHGIGFLSIFMQRSRELFFYTKEMLFILSFAHFCSSWRMKSSLSSIW